MNRLPVYLIAFGVFLAGTAELVVAGVLQPIAGDLGISLALAGQFVGAFSAAFAVGSPVLITLSSRMRRKKLLILSVSVFIIGCGISFGSSSFSVFLAARILTGISAGVFIVVATGSVAKLVPPERTGSAIGTIAFAFGSALTLGVPAGIALAEWWNWQAIFAVLGGLGLLLLPGLFRLLPEIEGDAPVSFRQQLELARHPVVVSGLFLSLFMNVGNSVMMTYLTPYLQTVLSMQTAHIAVLMVVFGIIGMAGSQAGGYAADKWGTVRAIALSLAVSALTLALLPVFADSIAAAVLLASLWIFSLFTTAPAVLAYFVQQAPRSANFVLGVNTSVIHIGLAAGAGAGGMLVNAAHTLAYHPWLSGLSILFGLAAAFLSFSLRKKASIQTD